MRVSVESDVKLASNTLEPPGRGAVHVWAWHLTVDEQTLAELEETLAVDEWQRVRRLPSGRHARRFVARRGMTRLILGRYLNLHAHRLQFIYGPQGKPALTPSFSSALEFNLSDSSELAVLAVATGQPLGIDIEQLRPIAETEDLAAHAFTAREVERLQRAAASRRAGEFFQLWTRSEAVAKAMGCGMRMSSTSLAQADAGSVPRRLRSPGDAEPASWRVYPLPAPAGYTGTLATSQVVEEMVYFACSPDLAPAPDS